MSYRRKLELLRQLEDLAADMIDREEEDGEPIRDAAHELRRLIDAEKPEPRWTAMDAYDGTYVVVDQDHQICVCQDGMDAAVIAELLNGAEERIS